MFVTKKAEQYIDSIRGDMGYEGYMNYKKSIANAMSVIVFTIEDLNEDDWKKGHLMEALSVISDFNYLLTELAKEN